MSKEQKTTRPSNNPNGRPKGSRNKRTIEAQAIFDEHEFCPLEKAIARLKKLGDGMADDVYLNACLKLARFKYAELKSIDHNIDPKKLPTEELLELAKTLIGAAEKANE